MQNDSNQISDYNGITLNVSSIIWDIAKYFQPQYISLRLQTIFNQSNK